MSFCRRLIRITVRAAVACGVVAAAVPAAAQLRIVDYNIAQNYDIAGDPGGLATILSAIGGEVRNGFAKPIDVITMQELSTDGVDAAAVAGILNGLYGMTSYMAAPVPVNATSGGNGLPGLVYNSASVSLLDTLAFGTVGSGSTEQPRSSLRYQLRPVGYGPAADFYLYSNHYKSDDGSLDQQRRNTEAQSVRANSDALGEETHAIYAGDFNIYHSDEPMYQTLLAAGPGQAFDPIDAPGSWSGPSFKTVHTQSPATIPAFTGQVIGGLNDRFDFQLVTGEFLDDEGLSYINGSYRAFGNNGTHDYGQAITTGSGAAPAALTALASVSDHLPVVADYQLPAKMDVQIGAAPQLVAVGSAASVNVLVQNIASAINSVGADELDYTLSVSGDLIGVVVGTLLPLSAASSHQVTLDTSTVGTKSGVITVATASQGAGNPLFTIPVSFVVSGPGTPVRVTVAKDDFAAPMNLVSYSQNPPPSAYSSPGDGFQRYQAGVSTSIPLQLLDTSATGSDSLGIVDASTKTDCWFGITDTVNDDDLPAGSPGIVTASWTFNVSGASALEVSIDMAAMGDFEASGANSDFFNWTYSIDGANPAPLFTSSVSGGVNAVYTLAGGNEVSLLDPLAMTTAQGHVTQLSNVFQTLASSLSGVGTELTIELTARTDGGDESYAFDNVAVTGLTALFDGADFNEDGAVDGEDLVAWEAGFGATSAEKGQGDADDDGDVDGADFLAWQQQFNASESPGAAASVPESGAYSMAIGAAIGLTFTGSRRYIGRPSRPESPRL